MLPSLIILIINQPIPTVWTNVASNYSGNNIVINNLTLNTNYDWRIQSNCSPDINKYLYFCTKV